MLVVVNKSSNAAEPAVGRTGEPAVGRTGLVLAAVLRLMRPVVRLLLRHGVQHRSFAVALKQVFLQAAQDELKSRGMSSTDSAITVLSGVHRRDVRTLLRDAPHSSGLGLSMPAGLASEVVGRWLSDRRYRQRNGQLRIYACALTDDDSRFDLGTSLAASLQNSIKLEHHRCQQCVRLGATLSG